MRILVVARAFAERAQGDGAGASGPTGAAAALERDAGGAFDSAIVEALVRLVADESSPVPGGVAPELVGAER